MKKALALCKFSKAVYACGMDMKWKESERVIQRCELTVAFGNAVVTADNFSLASAKKIPP